MPIFVLISALLVGFFAPVEASIVDHTASRGNAAAVPNLDIESGCRDLSRSQLNKTTNFSGCIGDEQNARTQLQKSWASFPRSMQEQCIHLVTPPALPSYIALRQCLDMAREAEKLGVPNLR